MINLINLLEEYHFNEEVSGGEYPPYTSKFKTDHGPNPEWLAKKRSQVAAEEEDEYGVPYIGSITGYFTSYVRVPVSLLYMFQGEKLEQQNVRHTDLRAIKQIMKSTGKLPLHDDAEYAPYIEVAYNGKPFVSEGNHRIMAAYELGWKWLPIELRYFDGGDTVDGPLTPEKVAEWNNITMESKQ